MTGNQRSRRAVGDCGRMRATIRLLMFAAMLMKAGTAAGQAPDRRDARNAAERAAYDRALCIHNAMTRASEVFTPASSGPLSPAVQEAAKRELAAYERRALDGARACLTEAEVYALGRFSYFDDVGGPCDLERTPALGFERTPNNSVGDLINGATRWQQITDLASIDAHPFFRAQAEARRMFKGRDREICATMLEEFGPQGSVLPGLVRKQ